MEIKLIICGGVMNNVTSFFLGIFLCVVAPFCAAQKLDCINVKEIQVPFSSQEGIVDDIAGSENKNEIYYTEADEFSFWYKIKVVKDCEVNFYVLSTNSWDEYDYMLYQFKNSNFCEELVNNSLAPINDTYYHHPATGDDRYAAHQKKLTLRKGEVYYVSVMNIVGEDCGHQFYLEENGRSLVINSVKKPCFQFMDFENFEGDITELSDNSSANLKDEKTEFVSKTKEEAVKNIYDNIPEINYDETSLNLVDDSVIIKGFVRDNESGKAISGKIVFEDDVTGMIFTFNASASNGFKIVLERSRRYKLNCSSLGFYEIAGVIEFMKPSTYDFYLLKVKAGERFIANNITFYDMTYALEENSIYELEELANYMKMHKDIKIQVEAHVNDGKSIEEINPLYGPLGKEWNFIGTSKKLTDLRAEAVKHYLVADKIDPTRITTKGFANTDKLVPTPANEEEAASNDRIQILVTSRSQVSTEFQSSNPDD